MILEEAIADEANREMYVDFVEKVEAKLQSHLTNDSQFRTVKALK